MKGVTQSITKHLFSNQEKKIPTMKGVTLSITKHLSSNQEKKIPTMKGVTLSITKHLFSNQEKNMVFSPLSLFAVLSTIAAGSAGRTLQELLSFLQFDSVDHLTTFFNDAASSHRLSFANGVWTDKSLSLRDSFKQLVETHYKATLNSADFQKGAQVCREVNTWVEKETNGHIKDLLPPGCISKLTGLIFANALHFKGAWKYKFDASRTRDDDFHLLNGTSVKVPFMRNHKKYEFWFINTFDDFKVLRLFYEQGRDEKCQFSMDIYLPNAKDGLPALIEKLASKPEFLEDNCLPQQKVQARLKIPKFKFSFAFEASQVLKELGVVLPFILGRADFTKMAEKEKLLAVGSIFHKAFIEVNEEETEAAAAIAAEMRMSPRRSSSPIDFVANHPFLFLVRENFTGAILFVGQVLNPLDGKARPGGFEETKAGSRQC